jgi:hypothetical protein
LAIVAVSATLLTLGAGTRILAGEEQDAIQGGEARTVPEIRAYRVNPHAPVIDGNLDDPVWSNPSLHKLAGFTQTDPDEGEAVTERTEVAVAYDEDGIYVAFWCHDSEPDKIARQLVRRDRWSESDMVSLRLDPYHDHMTGYMFTLSAAGSQRDQRVYNDNNTDISWDAVWLSGVQMQPWGWSAEVKIPYHCLRFHELDEQVWGIDFVRVINRKAEWQDWAFVPSSEGGMTSHYGHLTGLDGIEPARHLEVLPYAVSTMETGPGRLGNEDGRDLFGNTGVDIKYGISSNLTLDATINPDFGQVELDAPVLNLSSYETFFSERRPFFLEGSDLFSTEFNMFYSRRIGRSPVGGVDDDQMIGYTDWPKASTILGAAKLTGKLAGGTSIAFLTAVTDEESAGYAAEQTRVDTLANGDEIEHVDTVLREGVVEPLAGYAVMRIKHDLFERSNVGLIFTVAGQDTYHPAVTGGFDWRLFTNDGKWYYRGQAIFSRDDPEETGFGCDMTLGKDGGEHMRGLLSLTIKDPNLHINRLGYTSRNDISRFYTWWQYRTTEDWWIIRNTWNNINIFYSENYAGAVIERNGDWNIGIDFTNNWNLSGGFNWQDEPYNDLETRGNGLWEWPVYPTYSWWMQLSTDSRRKFQFIWNPGSGGDRDGNWWASYFGVAFRPRSNMEFSAGMNYHRTFHGLRWVDNESFDGLSGGTVDSSLFAYLDKDQVSLSTSVGIMLTRNLSCQLSAEGLISGLDYRNYRFYRGGQQYGPAADGYNYDYNWGSLNSTFLVRWEYRPGNTIYMVWTRSKSDYNDTVNDLNVSRDLDRFFSTGSENLFLVKASYWLSI